MNGVVVYKQWSVIQIQEKRNPLLFNNIDEPGGHYAKWNKPERDRQIL